MTNQDLRDRLSAATGTVTISQSTLTSGVGQLLATCYGDQPITISGASQQPGDGAVSLSGRSTFLGVADLPVTARFEADAQGEVHGLLRYTLRDSAPREDAWIFSRSFPSLPPVLDYSTPATVPTAGVTTDLLAGQGPFLDELDLFDTAFVVSTHDGADPATGVPLSAGINLVSKLRPGGMLGVLEYMLGSSPVLALYGTIRLPQPTDKNLALRPGERIWDRPDLAGIHLQAALGMDLKLGGVTFRDAKFRIYSPTSQQWMQSNPFQPTQGYSGSLAIPSAGVEVKLGADVRWNLPEATLYGDAEGVSLGKLAQLLDLTGTDSLSSHLPADLQKAVETVGRLELMHVGLQVGLAGGTPAVHSMYCTVGIPDLDWKVWGDHLVVEDLACLFAVTTPVGALTPSAAVTGASQLQQAGSAVSVTVYGTVDVEGVPLNISCSSDDGFTLRADTAKTMKLPVDKLVKTLAPGVAPPSALAVNYLGVTIKPGKSYEMTALLAGAPDPWVIPVGKVPLTVSDVMLSLACAQGQAASGTFAGKIAFSDRIVLEAVLESPGDFTVRSFFRKINLGELLARLCDSKGDAPGGFDVTIESASVLIEKKGDSYTFLVMGSVKDFGLLAMEVRKVPGTGWGFATGVDLSSGGLSRLPGLGACKLFEDNVKLDKLMLVLSTFDDAAFQFPSLAKFKRPDLGSAKVPARASGGVMKGLMAFGEWTLRADNKKENLLRKLLGAQSTLSVALALGTDPFQNSQMYVEARSSIQGHAFDVKYGMEVSSGIPDLFLTGTLSLKVMGTQQTFGVTGVFAPGGMLISASMQGSTALDFKVFKLSNLAVQVGVDWAGIPSLGLAGTIDVKKFESSLAVFFDSTDPAKSLVAGSLDPLSLKDVMDTLLGSLINTPLDEVLKTVNIQGTHQFTVPAALASDLDGLVFDQVAAAFGTNGKVTIPSAAAQLLLVVNAKGSAWHLTDLTKMRHYQLRKKGDQIEVSVMPQFYFASVATAIGGVRFPQGYYVNGALNFAGFKAEATIDIATGRGVSVEAKMDRIVIGNESLFSIQAEQGGGGPVVSISTFSQQDNPVKEFRLPHFYVNGQLSMLGVKEKVFASLTTKGLALEVSGQVAPAVHLDVRATAGGSGLDLGGQVKVGVGTIDLGALGKIKVNTDLEGSMGITADAKKIDAWVEASCKFMGKGIQLGRAKLDTSPDAIARLAETMAKKVEAELRKLFADAEQWANAMKNGLVDGVQDTAKVFRDVYGKSAQVATQMANDVAKGMTGAANAVAKGATDAANTVAKGTTQAANTVASGAKDVTKDAGHEASKDYKKAKKWISKL